MLPVKDYFNCRDTVDAPFDREAYYLGCGAMRLVIPTAESGEVKVTSITLLEKALGLGCHWGGE
jgi:hypothetical protein